MGRARRQKWKAGDYFSLPLEDGSCALGQVIAHERSALNSAVCAFFARRQATNFTAVEPKLTSRELLSVQFVTTELLESGVWAVFANAPPFEIAGVLDIEEARSRGFIGTKIRGAGVMRRMMNAVYGMERWDVAHDPAYLENLLVSPDRKQPTVH